MLTTALAAVRAGLSIIPIDHASKRPTVGWKPYQSKIVDEFTIRQWLNSGETQSIAIVAGKVSGGLLALDIDRPEFYDRWAVAVGDLAKRLPVQRTGGGGYQVFWRCPHPGKNDKLAWANDDTESTGRTIAIETRAEGGYAIVAPSLHPTGKHYQWIGGLTAADVPMLSQEHAEKLLAAARALDEAPMTLQDRQRVEDHARKAHQQQKANRTGQTRVIDAFNQAHPIEGSLEKYGYTKAPNGRLIRPGGNSESVSVKDGRSCHWSTNDPLNDGKFGNGACGVHDSFDVYCIQEHAGSVQAAVKAAAEALGIPESDGPEAGEGGGDRNHQSQAQKLVNLAKDAKLWHDGDIPYATIDVGGHRENHPITSKTFKEYLAKIYWDQYRGAAGGQAVQDALNVVAARAKFEGQQHSIAIRIGRHNGAIYLDLCNEKWQAVEITRAGWQVVNDPPGKFIRKRGMQTLPEPVTGGRIEHLRQFINAADDSTWIMIVAWLIMTFNPTGPYPVLVLNGEQGSAKSTTCRVLRRLVDPNDSDVRSTPRDERDLMIAATNGWIVGFDNLSGISPPTSDSICRLATGGGFATRELYTDGEEKILQATRPVMLNGIDDLGTRPDLAERSISLVLPVIPDDHRTTEAKLWEQFEQERPKILGAILDAVATALDRLPTVKMNRHPRMADFAKWIVAAEPALGWPVGKFMAVYDENRESSNNLAVENSAIGPAVLRMMDAGRDWEGTATALLAQLELAIPLPQYGRRPQDWPKNAKATANALRRIAPALRQAGIFPTFHRNNDAGRARMIHIKKVNKEPSAQSVIVQNPEKADDPDDAPWSSDYPLPSGTNPDNGPATKAVANSDDPDGQIPTLSKLPPAKSTSFSLRRQDPRTKRTFKYQPPVT